jgi:hypothetical protein
MSNPHPEKYRSVHATSSKVNAQEKHRRLVTWKHWHRYGLRGKALVRKAKMDLTQVRRWAAELDFDLEGLA